MDFSDLDRDVLLQEIKQIQQTIEASGGNFESYSSEDDEDDSDEESDLEEWKQNETNVWEVFGNGEGNQMKFFLIFFYYKLQK